MDAGNLFIYGREYRPRGSELPKIDQRHLGRADLIAQIYAGMKVHGVAVGASDMVLGANALQAIARKHRLPLLSANLKTAGGKRIFADHRVVTTGGIKFGIFGLTGPNRRYPKALDPAKYKVDDAVTTAQAQVKALKRKGAQVIIALAAIGDAPARALADKVPGLSFVFVSGTARHRPTLERRGTAFLSEITREGKYIGHLTLHVRGKNLQFEDFSDRYVVSQNIARIEKSLVSAKRRAKFAGDRGRPDRAQNRIQRMEGSLARLRGQLYAANKRQPKGSFLTNVLTPCALTLPEDGAIAKLITTRAKAANLTRPRGAK